MIVIRKVFPHRKTASFSLLGYGLVAGGTLATGTFLSNRKVREKLKEHPTARNVITTLLAPQASVGIAAGRLYSRRRRTKKGKVIIEQVRR